MAALTMKQLIADPTLLAKERARLEAEQAKNGTLSMHARYGLHPDFEWPWKINGKEVDEETYYTKLGEEIEKHPIGGHSRGRGCGPL